MDKEVLYVGGSFLLSPVVACSVALALYFATNNAWLPIIVGTVVGMAVYIAGCIMCARHEQAMKSARPQK